MSRDDGRFTHTRREFLARTGAIAGAAALGVGPAPKAAAAMPKRGGQLRFATRSDAVGLDPHRNIHYYVSHPLSAMNQGLLDLDYQLNPVAGIAEEWDVSKDLKTYTFKLRKGVEYHNGRTVDAASIKWNYERILDPKIGHTFVRSSLLNVERIEALGKDTVRCHLKQPSGVFLSNVVYYPCGLLEPSSVDQADTHPITCGPFKFKSWKHRAETRLERFENYFETGQDGKPLPYLDGIIGLPRKEDRVRLTALRAGEVDLIENMSYADGATFEKDYGDKFNVHPVPQVGLAYVAFNLKNGPFAYSTPGSHDLRRAAAHAFNHEAVHEAVFNGLSAYARGFYSKDSPWYMPEVKSWPEYDPDKAKFYMKKANYNGEQIMLVSRQEYPYMHQTGELTQSMWSEVGFNVQHDIQPNSVLRARYRKGEWSADSTANSYRPDPDGWYSRNILSTAASTKLRTNFNNPKVDKLILEARATLDKEKRRQLYIEVENIINEELPIIYSHFVPLTGASVKALKDYKPAVPGPFSYHAGGVRIAWFET